MRRLKTIRRQVRSLREQMGEAEFAAAMEVQRGALRICACHDVVHDANGCTFTWTKDGEVVRCACLVRHVEAVVGVAHAIAVVPS